MVIASRARAYSVLELVITVAILALLLSAVSGAVTRLLDSQRANAASSDALRAVDELATRLSEEARSSTAVFVPAVDVLGQPNGGSLVHEVDFFRKASDGSRLFTAYRLDVSSSAVERFDYQPNGTTSPTIVHRDMMAGGITCFVATRISPSDVKTVVDAGSVAPVNIFYGAAELVGGNGIVDLQITPASLDGSPPQVVDLHLSTRTAPTDLSIAISSATPTPSPGPGSSPQPIPFLILSLNPHHPHGPNQQGDPGNTGSLHGPGVPGTVYYVGNGSGATVDWFSFYNTYRSVSNGTYTFRDANGLRETLTISCDSGPCPQFQPLPVPTSGPTVLFRPVQ